ncbi:MAG: hypothetical protein KME43_18500 [Myxacorys chilensis ATA2-1-KO14]|nr:hypothetical protein [Myxacorys chilensis ATA2-1-KO14]
MTLVNHHYPVYYEQRYQEQMVKGLRKKAQALGFELVAAPSTQLVS